MLYVDFSTFLNILRKLIQDGRLPPAYFLPNYNVFDQFFQTVKKREYCFESSFQKFSTNINSIADFYNSWHYRLIRVPKQCTKPKVFFWITSWDFIWDLDSGNYLKTETLVEEVQSIVLDRWIGISRRTTFLLNLWNSQRAKFPVRAIKLDFSHFKTIQNFKLAHWRLDEEMLPVALEKHLVLLQSSSIHKPNSYQLRFKKILEGRMKKLIIIEPSCIKTKLLFETLTEKKSWELLLGEPSRGWISRRIIRLFIFWLLWLIQFLVQGNKCIARRWSNVLRVKKCQLIARWTKCSQQFWTTKGLTLGKNPKLLWILVFLVLNVSDEWNVSQPIYTD